MTKRGISTVVATVLIILITLSIIAIVWVAIVNLTGSQLSYVDESGKVQVLTSGGYTAYSPSTNKLSLLVEQEGGDNIEKIKIILYMKGGDTQTEIISKDEVPGPNMRRAYTRTLDVSFFPEYVSLVAFYVGGSREIEGNPTPRVSIPVSDELVMSEEAPLFGSGCESDSDCSVGMGCYNGDCTLVCSSDTDCASLPLYICSELDLIANNYFCNTDNFCESNSGASVPVSCNDGNECTSDSCTSSGCVNSITAGQSCSGGIGTCQADGSCLLPCYTNSDCDISEQWICSDSSTRIKADYFCDLTSNTCELSGMQSVESCGSVPPCQVNSCSAGVCSISNLPIGTQCNKGTCDGLGICVPSCGGTTSYLTPFGVSQCLSSWGLDNTSTYGKCGNSNDALTNTEWITGTTSDPQNIIVDLGSVKCVDGVRAYVGAAYVGQVVNVGISEDKITWKNVNSGWTLPINVWDSKSFTEARARYVSFDILSSSGYSSISEISVNSRSTAEICSIDGDCDDLSECTSNTCVSGVCNYAPIAEGTDCSEGVGYKCNFNGACAQCSVNLNCDDKKECTDDYCVGGACYNMPGAKVGQSCSGGTGTCQIDGSCLVPSCSGVSVSQKPPYVFCSNQYSSTYNCSRSIDSSNSTGWFSLAGTLPYVDFDLGSVKCISGMHIYPWSSYNNQRVNILVSSDSASWVTVYSSWTIPTGATWNPSPVFSTGEVPARYLRVQYLTTPNNYASIVEANITTRSYV